HAVDRLIHEFRLAKSERVQTEKKTLTTGLSRTVLREELSCRTNIHWEGVENRWAALTRDTDSGYNADSLQGGHDAQERTSPHCHPWCRAHRPGGGPVCRLP